MFDHVTYDHIWVRAGKERSNSNNKDAKAEVTVKVERQSRGGDDTRGNGHSRNSSRGGDDVRNNSRGGDDVRGSSRGSDDGRSSGHGSGADSKGVRADRKEGGSHSDRKAEKEKRESLKEAKDRGSPMLGRYVCFLVGPGPRIHTPEPFQSKFKWRKYSQLNKKKLPLKILLGGFPSVYFDCFSRSSSAN